MTAADIALLITRDRPRDARAAIIMGHTQQEAAILTLDVLQALAEYFNSGTVTIYDDAHEKLRRCLEGHS